jgi:hypothetical protein
MNWVKEKYTVSTSNSMDTIRQLESTKQCFRSCGMFLCLCCSALIGCSSVRFQNLSADPRVRNSSIFGKVFRLSLDSSVKLLPPAADPFESLVTEGRRSDEVTGVIMRSGTAFRVSGVAWARQFDFPFTATYAVTLATVDGGLFDGRVMVANQLGVSILPDYIALGRVRPLVPISGRVVDGNLIPDGSTIGNK